MMAHVCDSSTQEAEARKNPVFEISLGYIMSSSSVLATYKYQNKKF